MKVNSTLIDWLNIRVFCQHFFDSLLSTNFFISFFTLCWQFVKVDISFSSFLFQTVRCPRHLVLFFSLSGSGAFVLSSSSSSRWSTFTCKLFPCFRSNFVRSFASTVGSKPDFVSNSVTSFVRWNIHRHCDKHISAWRTSGHCKRKTFFSNEFFNGSSSNSLLASIATGYQN